MYLRLILHFHDDFLARVRGAIDVVYQSTCIFPFRKLFVIQKGEVGYYTLAFQQVVQEIYQQIFGQFLTEDFFEPVIGERIDKLSHNVRFFWL